MYRYRLLMIVPIGYLAVHLLIWFRSRSYVAELRLSFSPHRMWISFLLGLLTLLSCWYLRRKLVWLVITFVYSLFLFGAGIWYFDAYSDFYSGSQIVQEDQQDAESLSFLYANIWYKNREYLSLLERIERYDPDVLLLVEYAPAQHERLYPILQHEYPYINREDPKRDIGGRVIYSKYPLENLAETLPGDDTWRYGYVSLTRDTQKYVFYLVHTTAPNRLGHRRMRNEQIENLGEDVLDYIEERATDEMVTVIGDFNLSPWSPVYEDLDQAWSGHFTNMTRFLPGVMTRSLFSKGIVSSHIDHVWTNTPEALQTLEQIDIDGSDHEGFFGRIENRE